MAVKQNSSSTSPSSTDRKVSGNTNNNNNNLTNTSATTTETNNNNNNINTTTTTTTTTTSSSSASTVKPALASSSSSALPSSSTPTTETEIETVLSYSTTTTTTTTTPTTTKTTTNSIVNTDCNIFKKNTEIINDTMDDEASNNNIIVEDTINSESRLINVLQLIQKISLKSRKRHLNDDDIAEQDYYNVFLELAKSSYPDAANELNLYRSDMKKIIDFFKAMPKEYRYRLLYATCVLIAKEEPPSCAISLVFHIIPGDKESISNAVSLILSSFDNVPSIEIIRSIIRLVNWIPICTYICPNLYAWIVEIMEKLRECRKYVLVKRISVIIIKPLYTKLVIPLLRSKIAPIIFDILSSEQCSSEILDAITPHTPQVLEELKKDYAVNPETREIYEELVTIIISAINQTGKKASSPSQLSTDLQSNDIPNNLNKYTSSNSKMTPLRTSSRQQNTKLKFVGITNTGNICYINSVLQALFMTEKFRKLMTQSNCMEIGFKTIKNIFTQLQNPRSGQAVHGELGKALKPARFGAYQQDSSEFMNHLLDLLIEEELKYLRIIMNGGGSAGGSVGDSLTRNRKRSSANNIELDTNDIGSTGAINCNNDEISNNFLTIVKKLFGGTLLRVTECSSCGFKSKIKDTFKDLQLAIPDFEKILHNRKNRVEQSISDIEGFENYIDDNGLISDGRVSYFLPRNVKDLSTQILIDYFFSPEVLDKENRYSCSNCKQLRKAERVNYLIDAPKYLILTLCHFEYDRHNGYSKIMTKIDMCEYIKINLHNNTADGDKQELMYKFYATILHSGSNINCGHYYTIAADSNNNWYKFDDDNVEKSALRDMDNLYPPNTPYIIFYRLCTQTEINQVMSSKIASNETSFETSQNEIYNLQKTPEKNVPQENKTPSIDETTTSEEIGKKMKDDYIDSYFYDSSSIYDNINPTNNNGVEDCNFHLEISSSSSSSASAQVYDLPNTSTALLTSPLKPVHIKGQHTPISQETSIICISSSSSSSSSSFSSSPPQKRLKSQKQCDDDSPSSSSSAATAAAASSSSAASAASSSSSAATAASSSSAAASSSSFNFNPDTIDIDKKKNNFEILRTLNIQKRRKSIDGTTDYLRLEHYYGKNNIISIKNNNKNIEKKHTNKTKNNHNNGNATNKNKTKNKTTKQKKNATNNEKDETYEPDSPMSDDN